MKGDTVDMVVSNKVTGGQGLNLTLNYEKTSLSTVVCVQLAEIGALLRVAKLQAKKLGISAEEINELAGI